MPNVNSRAPIPKSQKWIRITILAIGIFVTVCFLVGDPVMRSYRKRDMKDAVAQQGAAEVVTVILPRINEMGDRIPPFVSVRFRGGIYTASKAYNTERLTPGKQAHILYRVGKSGEVVVDSVDSLEPSASP